LEFGVWKLFALDRLHFDTPPKFSSVHINACSLGQVIELFGLLSPVID